MAMARPISFLKAGWLVGLLIVLLVASLGTAGYFYWKYRSLKNDMAPASSTESASDVAAKVGKLIELPTGETPSLATVLDKSKLSGQAFFDKSQNGDKVLIYSKAGEAIIYRESSNKIIMVGPVSNSTAVATPTPKPSATPTHGITATPKN